MRKGRLPAPPRLGQMFASLLWLAACLLIAPAAQAQSIDVSPSDGTGTATETGNNPVGGEYTATLDTSFSPSHIDPGDPFTYTTSLDVQLPNGASQPCTPFSSSQTFDYISWEFSQMSPGDNLLVDPSVSNVPLASDFSNTTTTEDTCPAEEITSGPMVVPVSGAESQNLQSGCYQSTVLLADLYFPFGGTEPQVHSLSGTVGTLTVGDTPGCAKESPGVTPKSKTVTFAESGSGSLGLECELAKTCKGKVVIEEKKDHHGRVHYPRCGSCFKIAAGHYAIPAGKKGKAKLELTKFGEQLLFPRGGCRHCGKLVHHLRPVPVPYPHCKKCKIGAQLVITGSNGVKSRTPIRLERGNCRHCG